MVKEEIIEKTEATKRFELLEEIAKKIVSKKIHPHRGLMYNSFDFRMKYGNIHSPKFYINIEKNEVEIDNLSAKNIALNLVKEYEKSTNQDWVLKYSLN